MQSLGDPIERVSAAVELERSLIPGLFTRDTQKGVDHRIACFNLTRAVDYAFLVADLTKTPEHVAHARSVFRGFVPALSHFLDGDGDLPGVPNAPSNAALERWADGILTRLDVLAQAERLLGLYRAGLIECAANEASRVVFQASPGAGLPEQRDVAAGHWMGDMAVLHDDDEYRDLRERWPRIRQLLRENVHRFGDDYMGYSALPELDAYYERVAALHGRRNVGLDTFEPMAEFGGMPFVAYGATATALVGFAYKHMHFAIEAAALFPNLNPRNLITTWVPLAKKAEFVAGALDCEYSEAVELLRPFVASPASVAPLAAVFDAPAPFFIPVGQGYCASSVAAAIVAPYDLLLRRLKADFKDDWFRHINAREATFRENLRWMLPVKRVHFADKPVVLKDGGKTTTDLDAVALVKATGTLGIFQLKWQDLFGGDLRERRSRMSNLTEKANQWVDRVSKWIESHGTDSLLKLCGFPQEAMRTVKSVRLFVLGRYHVNFSGGIEPDRRAAWSTWPELVRFVDQRGSVADPVLTLFDDMVAAQHNGGDTILASSVTQISLRDLDVELRWPVSAAAELAEPEHFVIRAPRRRSR